MPVQVSSSRSSHDRERSANWPGRELAQVAEEPSGCVRIGLINNMAAAAFPATERQFISLLDSASEGIPIELSLYTVPGIPRTELNRRQGDSRYSSVETMWETRLDGLIVTGREPMTPDLRDEPYWESFTKVLEWARDNTHSTVWSCLAAHGAILHMDGIARRKSNVKHCGILECARVSDHLLTADTPQRFHIPHSRWNGVAEEELAARGYTVLARTADAGVDSFIKQENSLFVFFQGHPEYESDTLLREYRRDVGRYLRREADTYPSIPRTYFDRSAEGALIALREQAIACRNEEFVAHVAAALESIRIENTWSRTAACLYRNWLEYIRAKKIASQGEDPLNVECTASS